MTISYRYDSARKMRFLREWQKIRDEEEEQLTKSVQRFILYSGGKEMIVDTTCSFLKPEDIEVFEREYKAKYILETDLRSKDKFSGVMFWANRPGAIFYTEKAHPQGSNYFALYFAGDTLMITDGLPSIKDVVFKGLEAEGEVIYSRYRHDYREGKNGAFVDGGRDYFRYGGDSFSDYNVVEFKVVGDHLEIIKESK